MPKTHFTADPHFGHDNIIRFCNRPFFKVGEDNTVPLDAKGRFEVDTELMDNTLVRNWNAVVRQGDIVRAIGDMAYKCKPEHALKYFRQLNGDIFVLPGNHDPEYLEVMKLAGFHVSPMNSYEEITVDGQIIVLNHYPMRDWHHCNRGVWHLHGHVHSCLKPHGKSLDVGVDAWNYFPVSFEKIKDAMSKRKIGPHAEFPNFTPGG